MKSKDQQLLEEAYLKTLNEGAEVPVYVKVLKLVEDVLEVYAVTTEEGKQKAKTLPMVHKILDASYERDELN